MEKTNTANDTKTYTCPMHPEVRKETPGLCPECGMSLMKTQNHAEVMPPNDAEGEPQNHAENNSEHRGNEHDKSFDWFDFAHHRSARGKHAGHSTHDFLKKFWVSLVISVFIVIYSDLPQAVFGWNAPAFLGSQYIPLVLGSIVFFYGGLIFLTSAWRELKARLPGMMTLIALATTTAYVYSVFVTMLGGKNTLFWELATLITVMLLGHWVEMKAVTGAQGALKELSKLLPDTAEVVTGQKSEVVPTGQLKVGDIVLVRPGARVPADGRVAEGSSPVY